ncbi:hypothetical protein ACFSSA_15495 [Luteolibacter algae]|uniref:Uncharacterized protein n=1 Tax=Luteolibacter algae TaxID=454151 RepID=A0ABW5DFF6_9BACT
MNPFRSKKLRFLYLLALAQLLGGPIVLLHITLFSKMVLTEAPDVGFANAIQEAWLSEAFQHSFTKATLAAPDKFSTTSEQKKSLHKKDVRKDPFTSWFFATNLFPPFSVECLTANHIRTWTPAWPNAPPGPPPRMA